MESDREAHWQGVYTAKAPDSVSWFQPSAEPSLRMIDASALAPPAAVVDVGAGASGLVDELVRRGFKVTVLDIAEAALAVSRERLGSRAEAVAWEVADITRWHPTRQYDLWHDRAVFHFLTEPADRQRYVAVLKIALRRAGVAIFATFAEDGPDRCSGLPVRRYSADALAAELGDEFVPIRSNRETHVTPWGSPQSFTWAMFRRSG